MPATLTASTQKLLEALPPFEQGSKDVQAVLDVLARELDRLEAAKDTVRAQATPQSADLLLSAWESVLGLQVNPVGKTLQQRRDSVVGYVQRIKSIGTGPQWVAALTRLIGSNWTYEEFIPVIDRLTNLVTNPSFEVDLASWSASGARLVAGATLTRVTATPWRGAGAMQVVTAATANQGADFASLSVTKGRTYWVSFYVRGNAGGEPLELRVGDGTVGSVALDVTPTTGWNRYSVAFVPTASGTTGVAIRTKTAVARTFFIDGVQVATQGGVPLTAAPAYFDGGVAGYEWAAAANASASRKINTVPAWTIRMQLPNAAPLTTPTGLTATPSATGGTLAAATWHYKVTAFNTFGETLATADVTAVTTGATGSVALAWTAVAGAAGYRVYRGTTTTNHALLSSPATNAYTDTGTATSATVPPSANTTQGFTATEARNLARVITPAHIDLTFGYTPGFIIGVSKIGIDVL